MIHQNSFNIFRVNEWPKAQASHLMYFKAPRHKYNLGLILEHLAKELNDSNRAYVKHTDFTLVNVYSHIASLSFGYQQPPNQAVRANLAPLNCTFAFTYNDTYDDRVVPRFIKRRTPYARIWGTALRGTQDFMTINIPKKVMREANLLIPNLQEMAWLYMIIGAFTKGFAKRHSFYRSNDSLYLSTTWDPELAYAAFYQKKMPFMFKNVPYDEWIYSKEMWDLAPNIFNERNYNEDVVDYYCRYLAKDFYKKTRAPNVKKLEELAFSYVRSGLLDILSDSVHTSRYTKTVNAMTNHYFIEKTVNVEQMTLQILKGEL